MPAALITGVAQANIAHATAERLAREGHELMLQLPMEPFGFPAADPGPRTLRAGEAASSTMDDLMWHFSRFPGYFGIVN